MKRLLDIYSMLLALSKKIQTTERVIDVNSIISHCVYSVESIMRSHQPHAHSSSISSGKVYLNATRYALTDYRKSSQ